MTCLSSEYLKRPTQGLRSYEYKTKSFSSLISAKVSLQYQAGFYRNLSDSTAELLIGAQGPLFIGKRAAFLGGRKTQITRMQMHLYMHVLVL